jgi:hypothetical protein
MANAAIRYQRIMRNLCLTVSLIVVNAAILGGCTSKYGRIQSDNEITELFETQQILTDHTYYYHGFQAIPYVIVGIDNQYTLRSSIWQRVKLTPVLLKQLTVRMQSVYSGLPQGARITGPNDERLGIWYSSERQAAVRLREDSSIVLSAPQPPDMRGVP